MYSSAWDHIHNIPRLRNFRGFPAEMEKLDKPAKITPIRKKRSTDTIHVCGVADNIWERGISQCRAILELVSAPAMSIISLGHCLYGVWLLQRTISRGIGCKVNVGFVCDKWIKPAASVVRHPAVDIQFFKPELTCLSTRHRIRPWFLTTFPDRLICFVHWSRSRKRVHSDRRSSQWQTQA